MTRLERYREQLRELEGKRGRLMRAGKFLQAQNLNADLERAERLIREAEEYEEQTKSRPISELVSKEELDEMGIIPMMIECHLIADLLVDISYRVVDTMKDHGLTDISLMPDLMEIIKKADKFSSFLTTVNPALCDLLVRNETLNESQHKKYLKYIEQRLKPRKSSAAASR